MGTAKGPIVQRYCSPIRKFKPFSSYEDVYCKIGSIPLFDSDPTNLNNVGLSVQS